MENLNSLLSPTRRRERSNSPRPTRSSPLSGSAIPTTTSNSLKRNSEYQEHDRYIPLRSASNLQEAFERGSRFLDGSGASMTESSISIPNNLLMNNLLRASLLGESLSDMKATDAALLTGLHFACC